MGLLQDLPATFFYSTGHRLNSLLNYRIFLPEKHQILALRLLDPELFWLNCPSDQLLCKWNLCLSAAWKYPVSISGHVILYQNILLATFWSHKTYKHLSFLLIKWPHWIAHVFQSLIILSEPFSSLSMFSTPSSCMCNCMQLIYVSLKNSMLTYMHVNIILSKVLSKHKAII